MRAPRIFLMLRRTLYLLAIIESEYFDSLEISDYVFTYMRRKYDTELILAKV